MRTRYYGPKDRWKAGVIQIYGAYFEVVVCHNIDRALDHKRRVRLIGEQEKNSDVAACCAYRRSKVIVLFDRNWVTHKTIAHEVFHATHRIMEWNGVKVRPKHHEAGALLNDHLTGIVYDCMRKWKIKVKHEK